jgi:hypothetical protein
MMEINNIEDGVNSNVGETNPRLSAEEMLKNVDSAIIAVASGGQSYKIGSRELTRANLKDLYSIKNDLAAQLNSDNSPHLLDNCYVAVFSGR